MAALTSEGGTARRDGTVSNEGVAQARRPTVAAYVPYWDQTRGFSSAFSEVDLVDEVSPFWYSLHPDGSVVLADGANTRVDLEAVRALQGRGIRVLPTVTNLRDGDWSPETVQAVLHDDAVRAAHVRNLVDLTVSEGYDGIDIDYENLAARDREVYTAFVSELGQALHDQDKLLTTSVHPKVSDEGYDERNVAQSFSAIGEAVDQVRVMTYDHSWETSPPGPVAPSGWVEDVIAWTTTQIPPDKVVLGIALLGYDWVDGRGTTVDHTQAVELAREHGATIRRNEDGAPSFTYTDDQGRSHEVWWEDAVSAARKLPLVAEYDLGGIFLWRLGGEDRAIWTAVRDEL